MVKNAARDIRSRFYSYLREHNVCMLHIGRCGSTVLANMLNQHPKIHWKGEFFHEKNLHKYLSAYNTDDPFRALWLKSGAAKRQAFGFEIKAHPALQLSNIDETLEGMVEACMSRIDCHHYILLTRAHLLRRLVSFLAGHKRDQWNYGREETVERVRVRVPTGPFRFGNREVTLLEFLDLFDGINELWKSAIPDECKTLELEYAKDILNKPNKAYRRVAEWLELKTYEVEVKNRKVNKDNLSNVVENWKDVRKILENTEHEWMLDDET